MDVYTRPDTPWWYAALDTPTGRRRVSLKPLLARGAGAVRSSVARKAAQELQDGLDTGAAGVTLLDALNAYHARLERAHKPDADNVALARDKLLGLRAIGGKERWHLSPSMLVTELTEDHLAELVEHRELEGNSPQTIKHELGKLRAALKGIRGAPRLDDWHIPSVKERTRYLTLEEWQRLYAALDPTRPITRYRKATGKAYPAYVTTDAAMIRQMQDAQDLLVALTMCGGRWSEVAGLTWDKVNLEAGMATIWGSKTEKERLVPIPAQFLEVLHRRQADAKGLYVFANLEGAKRTKPSQAIRKAIKRAKLNENPEVVARHGPATIHALRHTFASWLLQAGATLVEVQDSLGHASITMTRRYAALEKVSTAKKMGSILSNVGV